ncbi:MAG: transporter substrate-binding domain-containing protein [Prevotellaceae bacterium]|nr:transporter substrate-binding domain-containing protein [Prevotellaceae bacterium]
MHARRIIITCLWCLALGINGHARQYTSANPLVYEDVWDLAPYAFINENGQPDGFNIDLVKLMMNRLGIPYTIKLKQSPRNFEDLENHKADLTIGIKAFYHDKYGQYNNNILSLFTHSVARAKDKEAKIKTWGDLRNNKVMVHDNSFSHNMMKRDGLGDNAIPVNDMKGALIKLNETGEGAILWNSMTMRTIISNNKLDNIRLTSVNMKYGEYHFMAQDSTLLARLDSIYDEITASEEVLALRKKWFYPEAKVTGIPNWLWYVVYTLAAVIVCMLAYNFFYRYRERKARRESERQTTQLELLLKSGNYRIWTYDIQQEKFRSVTIKGEGLDEYNTRAFSMFFHPDDFARIKKTIELVKEKDIETDTFTVRCHSPHDNAHNYYFDLNISILHEEYGEPTMLLGVQTDKTAERSKSINTSDSLLRFRTIFETAMAQMAYYDKDGIMTDINDSACETFGIVDKNEFLKSRMHISQVPVFHHLQDDVIDEIWVSSIVDFDDLRRRGELSEFWTRKGVVYYEFTIMPIYDNNGQLQCIVSAGRDITEIATQMNRERRRSKRIETASGELKKYVENINYALEVSDTQLANYDINTKKMEVTYDMHKPKLELSQLQCVHMVDASQTRTAANIMLRMDKKRMKKYKARFKTRMRDQHRDNIYYELNAVPMTSNDGTINHYFCLCRNITKLVETERQLAAETKKAQEAEKVKDSFLTNMSYEIRTPLNTVVGFAELFNAPHDKEDEKTFIEEIRKSSDKLLKLVNNILLLSRIDAKMLELNPQPTDFGELFKSYCLMGLSRGIHEGVKTDIMEREEPLIVEIDNAQTGHIIETLTLLSARFTARGYIRTRYEYHNGKVTFCIEDSGPGMDKASIARVTTRTYEGIKNDYNIELELTICHELASLMGGHMEIQSSLGRGTTIWVTLPCKNLLEELENTNANGI